MKIYEIEREIEDCIDLETGEIIDMDRLAKLNMERDKKIKNVALWAKELLATADAIKNEEEKLKHRREVAENKAESLKKFLSYILNGEKKEYENVAISYRQSESVVVKDATKIPTEFISEPKVTAGTPMKSEIKKAIKSGIKIEGAYIETKQNLILK